MPRRLPAGELMSRAGQHSSLRINRKNRDTVVSPVRAINKFPRGMDLDLSTRISARKVFGKSRESLLFGESARLFVIRERGDARSHFVDHINPFAARMEHEMAGASAPFDGSKAGSMGCHRGPGRVEVVNEHLVEAQITSQGETIGWIGGNEVGVRTFL